MSSTKSKLRLAAAFAALATLALAGSCRGFFVKPTLSSIAIGPPSPTIDTGSTNNQVQMFAVGTFNDGSSGHPTVTWSITPPTGIATISSTGLVVSVATGTATITATSNDNPSISGTQPLTVTVACTTAITINPTSGSLTPTSTTASFTASCNGGVDITEAATWVSSNTGIATVTAGEVSATQTANGTFTITASSNGITSNPVSITASGF